MFVLAEEFGIKPWECNEDGEVYKDDLTSLIALKYIKHEAVKHERERAELEATIKK